MWISTQVNKTSVYTMLLVSILAGKLLSPVSDFWFVFFILATGCPGQVLTAGRVMLGIQDHTISDASPVLLRARC